MMEDIKNIIESLLFVAEAPLSIARLKTVLDINEARTIRDALERLAEDYENRKGAFYLRQVAGGKHRLELKHTGLDGLDRKMEKGLNRFIVGLITSASIIAGSLVLNASHSIMDIEVHLFGVHVIPLTGLLGVTGYTIATILGVWLIFCIFRSGKM